MTIKQPTKLLTFVSKKNRQQFFLLSILPIQCYNTLLFVNDKPILNQHVKSPLYCRPSVFIVPFTCLLFIGILLPVHAQVGPTSPKLTRLVLVSGTITQKAFEDNALPSGEQSSADAIEAFIKEVIIDTLLNIPYSDEWINEFIASELVKKKRPLGLNEWLQIDHLIEDDSSGQVELYLSLQSTEEDNTMDMRNPKSSIQGILGAIPIEQNRWMIVGDLELQIPELWKVDQSLDFAFTRTDIDYTSAVLKLQEPVQHNLFVNAVIELEQRDSVFQQSILGIGGDWLVNAGQTYKLHMAWENSRSSKNVQSYLESYQALALQFGTDQLISFGNWNLASTLDIHLTYQKSTQSKLELNGRTDQWVQTLHLQTTVESPKTGIGNIRLQQVYDRVWAEELPWSYAIVFGGAKTLPGFYERQFDAQWAYRFKSGYVIPFRGRDKWEFFVAGAHFKNFESSSSDVHTQQTLWSAGFSYSFDTDFGNVQLALATPLWSSYKGSKLHLNLGR